MWRGKIPEDVPDYALDDYNALGEKEEAAARETVDLRRVSDGTPELDPFLDKKEQELVKRLLHEIDEAQTEDEKVALREQLQRFMKKKS